MNLIFQLLQDIKIKVKGLGMRGKGNSAPPPPFFGTQTKPRQLFVAEVA